MTNLETCHPPSMCHALRGLTERGEATETCHLAKVGNGISIRKITRNKLGRVFIIPQKKVLIPRHSEVPRSVNSKARYGTERNGGTGCNGTELREKINFTK